MVTIEVKNKDLEKVEELGEERLKKLIERETKAKNFLNYLKAQLQIVKAKKISASNTELVLIWEDLIKKYESFGFPKKTIKVIDIELEGWKGKESYDLYKGFDNDFRIIEIRKDKETGEITKSKPILVEKECINYLILVIKAIEEGKHYPAAEIWEKIINHYDLKAKNVDLLNFNGGGDRRTTYYFPLYLNPLRVLEKLKLIKIIDGRGGGLVKLM